MALSERLGPALRIERACAAVAGAEVRVLLTREHGEPVVRFLAVLLRDAARVGPGGWRRLLTLLRNRRLRVTLRRLHDERTVTRLRELEADVGLHAANVIYRAPVLESFRLGVLNAHIGLLPRYRGRSVMEWSLLEGSATGITTFFMDEGIDTGPRIVVRREVDVSRFGDVAEAKAHLFSLDGEMYAEALGRLSRAGFEPDRQALEDGTRYYEMSRAFTDAVNEILRTSNSGENGDVALIVEPTSAGRKEAA